MSDPDAQMALLRQRFHVRAQADRTAIAAALREGDRPALLRLAHGLAGIAGIFGHANVSARATAVEEAIEREEGDAALAGMTEALIASLEAVGSGG